jgi:Zn-dependent protease/CBS domain-containing protein
MFPTTPSPQPAGSTPRPAGRIPGSLGTITLFGIPVRFHFTFWLAIIWLIAIGASGDHSLPGMAIYVLAIFGSILLHELGHALAAVRYKIKTLEIVMLPLGGLARLERQPNPAEEFWVAISGPLVNFAIGAALLGGVVARGGSVQLGDWLKANDGNLLPRIATANLVLAFFNLLPAFPMDGGRVLRSLLATRRPVEDATRITARVGTTLAAGIGLYGLLSANFLLVFLAFFIYVGAAQETMAVSGQVLLRGAKVRAAMVTDFRTLSHGDTIREAAELLLATSQQDFPVLAGETVVGLLPRTALLRAMAGEGPESYVAGAMEREFVRLTPDMDLSEATPLLAQSGSCALVFEEGRLAGMLTAENLSEFLVLRQIRAARTKTESGNYGSN